MKRGPRFTLERADDAVLVLLTLTVVWAPWGVEGRHVWSVLTQIGIAVMLCQSYAFLWGQVGMLSFGHAVYAGVGAYAAAGVLRAAEQGVWDVSLALVPLMGGAAAGAVAAVLGLLACRHAGMAFAMITLGLGELVSSLAGVLPDVFGGESGWTVNRTAAGGGAGWTFAPAKELFVLVGLHVLVSALLWRAVMRSRVGVLLRAVRDNPMRVAFLGGRPAVWRWVAWVLACSLAGVAGALSTLQFEVVSPDVFSTHRSTLVLLFVVLGGSVGLLGPVLAGIAMVMAQSVLSGWTSAWSLYIGLAFVVVVMRSPDGLAGGLPLDAQPRSLDSGRGKGAGHRGWLMLALLGGVVLIEWVHRHQQRALDPDPVSRFGPWTLHWLAPGVVWTGGALALVGVLGVWMGRWRLGAMGADRS